MHRPTSAPVATGAEKAIIGGAVVVATILVLLTATAYASTALASRRILVDGARHTPGVITHLDNPAAAWPSGSGVPGPAVFWAVFLVLAAATAYGLVRAFRWWKTSRRASGLKTVRGMGAPELAREAAGRKAVLSKAAHTRPTVDVREPTHAGYFLGRVGRHPVYATCEEAAIVTGPPRRGKGLHLVIPWVLDAPGAVVTTATRPDTLAATLRARERRGPVMILDPLNMSGLPARRKWSLVRGCEDTDVAMKRARALAAANREYGRSVSADDTWEYQTAQALQAMLWAAAIAEKDATELGAWGTRPAAAKAAVDILQSESSAPAGWAARLGAVIDYDPRQRDSVWMGVTQALQCLASPNVTASLTPREGEGFDPAEFIREQGTVYLLGARSDANLVGGPLAAMFEDITHTARRMAGRSGGRLEPPLALILDEVASFTALPSLPDLSSNGGGIGISVLVICQGVSQLRARWGQDDAETLWNNATTKVILGGGGNVRDLGDISKLVGDIDDMTVSRQHRNALWSDSMQTSVRRQAILTEAQLQQIPFGQALLISAGYPAFALELSPWTRRRDAKTLQEDKACVERDIATAAAGV